MTSPHQPFADFGKAHIFVFAQCGSGPIAQLGERLNGIQEVSGSIPLGSTTIRRQQPVVSEGIVAQFG